MTGPGDGVVLLLVTASDRAEAERLGEALVERRLAAAGSVVPMVHSFVWADGRLRREHEALLLLETTAAAADAAQAALQELHPSGNPKVLRVPVSSAATAYLEWLAGAVRAD